MTFVFPTPVGVFLGSSRVSFHPLRLPHARGGVFPDSDTGAVEDAFAELTERLKSEK